MIRSTQTGRARRPLLFALAALAVIASIAAPAPAPAQTPAPSRLDDILAAGTLRVGTAGDYKPFTYFDKASGQFSGMDIELSLIHI